jgi:hypothetical protein
MTTIRERYERRKNQDVVDPKLEMTIMNQEGLPDVIAKLSGSNADIGVLLELLDEAKDIAFKFSDSPYGHDITLASISKWMDKLRKVVG